MIAHRSSQHEEIMTNLRMLLRVRDDIGFPAPQPVALTRDRLDDVLSGRREYGIGLKIDGERKLLFFTKLDNECVLLSINRKLDIEQLVLPGNFKEALFEGTVLDSEEASPQWGDPAACYVVFDAYAVAGRACNDQYLMLRLDVATNVIALCDSPRIEAKPMFGLERLEWFVKVYMQDPEHKFANDGVILTPVPDHVCCGTDELTLKWKPRHDLTCDFLVRRVTSRSKALWARSYARIVDEQADVELWFGSDGGRLQLFTAVVCQNEQVQDGQIWEFIFADDVWTPKRQRKDKKQPNYKTTVLKTLECARDFVELEELFVKPLNKPCRGA